MIGNFINVLLKLKQMPLMLLVLASSTGCASDLVILNKEELCRTILNEYPKSKVAEKAFNASPTLVKMWIISNEIQYSTFCEDKRKWISKD